MRVTCPECATRYDVDEAEFKAGGRAVRCNNCGKEWYQIGPATAQQATPSAAAEIKKAREPTKTASALASTAKPKRRSAKSAPPADDDELIRAFQKGVQPAASDQKKPSAPRSSAAKPLDQMGKRESASRPAAPSNGPKADNRVPNPLGTPTRSRVATSPSPLSTQPKIFLNYRRGDDTAHAHFLFHILNSTFDQTRLFMDVEGLFKPGDDFLDVLERKVLEADIVLALIGPRWIDILIERMGDDEDDFVLFEIGKALAAKKRVIPVLLGGAQMPRAANLPTQIRDLARRQAVILRPESFVPDAERFISKIREIT